jgi:hypothetical protein
MAAVCKVLRRGSVVALERGEKLVGMSGAPWAMVELSADGSKTVVETLGLD